MRLGSAPAPARTSDVAYAELRRLIVDLELAPGELVNEAALAERLGLGRMPVREALARLAQERFLTVLPRRGTVVPEISLTGVLDMLEAAELLEAGIAADVCRKASDSELAELITMFEAVDEAGRSGDYLHFLTVDHRAHVAMAEVFANPFVTPIAETTLLHNLRFWRYCHRRRVLEDTHIQSHTPLVDALRARDGVAAEASVRTLVTTARGSLQGLF